MQHAPQFFLSSSVNSYGTNETAIKSVKISIYDAFLKIKENQKKNHTTLLHQLLCIFIPFVDFT